LCTFTNTDLTKIRINQQTDNKIKYFYQLEITQATKHYTQLLDIFQKTISKKMLIVDNERFNYMQYFDSENLQGSGD
jgi:hypothetical protein